MYFGNSLVIQWLELHDFTVKGPGSLHGQGTKIPQAVWHSQRNINNKTKICIPPISKYKNMVLGIYKTLEKIHNPNDYWEG